MKTKITLTLLLGILSSSLFSQVTLNLRPDPSQGKDALINSQTASTNEGTTGDLACWSWTNNGVTNARSLLQFNLTSIPQNAKILSAKLNLYCNTTSAITQLHYGPNAANLKRITSSWEENTVTWQNQPSTSSVSQVLLMASTTNNQDYLNIDLTDFVTSWVADPSLNYGVMLQLQTEATYRSVILASSDHADSTKRPLLTIVYEVTPEEEADDCVAIVPDATTGKDALIEYSATAMNTNSGNNVDNATWSWTVSGKVTITRSLMEFPLTSLPPGSTLVSAKLTLKCNTTSPIPQKHSGDNAAVLKRITGSWSESTVTWNNQPAVTNSQQVFLSTSTSSTQDYRDINITNMVMEAIGANQNYIGLQLSLLSEDNYRSLIFASSDHADSTKRPKLVLCYNLPNQVSELNEKMSPINVFPNPTNTGTFSIDFAGENQHKFVFELYSMTGSLCKSGNFKFSNQIQVSELQNGIYQLVITHENGHKKTLPVSIIN